MKRKFYFFFAVLIFILFTVSVSAQQLNDYQSAGGGVPVDLSSATNWQYWNGSAWVTATQAPFALVGTNGTITIQSGDTWNNATALSLGSKNATIKFNGNTGTFSTTNKLTLNGNTYQHNVSGGEATIAAGITFSSGSTTIYSATSGTCTVPVIAFGSLTIAAGSTYSLAGAASTVAGGTLTVNGTLNCGSYVFSVKTYVSSGLNQASTLTGSGTITTGAVGTRLALGSSGGLVTNVSFSGTMCGVTLYSPVVLQSNLTISASGFTPQYYFNVSGIYTDLNGYTLSCGSVNGTTANIVFKNSSAGNLITTGAGTIASGDGNPFNNITIGGSTGLNSNILVNGIFNLSSGTFTTNAFTLSLGASATATIASPVTISTGGKIDFNNRPVTIVSTASGTGRINAIAGTLANAANVTIQQYLSAKRGWRLLGNPTSGAITLSTFASKSNIDLNNGTVSSATAYFYDPNQVSPATPWVAAGSAWNKNTGLLLFVRGTSGQGVGGGTYTPNNVTLSTTGTLVQGTQPTINLTYDPVNTNAQWNVLVNPFPCPLSAYSILGSNNNINQSIYYLNPNYTGSNGYTADGNYSFVTLSGSQDFEIPSFGSIFVQTQAAGQSLTLSESSKYLGGGNQGLFGSNTDYQVASLQWLDKSGNLIDRTELMLNATAQPTGNGHWDLPKLTLSSQYMYTLSNNKAMAINARSGNATDTIPLVIQAADTTHQCSFVADNYSLPDGMELLLKDKLLNTQTTIHQGTIYNFEVTADAATQGSQRFELIFSKSRLTSNTVADNTASINGIFVSPNPASDYVNVNLAVQPVACTTTIKMISLDGNIVKTVCTEQNGGTVRIPVKELANGLYILQVTANGKTSVQKIIKTN